MVESPEGGSTASEGRESRARRLLRPLRANPWLALWCAGLAVYIARYGLPLNRARMFSFL